MKAINITKYNQFTKHYYATFWNIRGYVNLEDIRNGYLTPENSDVFEDMVKSYGNVFGPIKADSEKELLLKAKKLLTEYTNETIFVVFFDNKYSDSRSEYIQSISCQKD